MSSDKGVRSIEVNISNMVLAGFTVGNVQKDSGDSWIKGEEPILNSTLMHYSTIMVGVMTTNTTQEVGGAVTLTGYGDPITIKFSNSISDQASCTCPGNDMVSATIYEVNTGDPNHAQYNLTLNDS